MYKILLVEDDPTITEVLERQLAKWGYEASHVTDFQHVLETFVQQAPHLVLLDISLTTAITGAARSAKSAKRPCCSSPPPATT